MAFLHRETVKCKSKLVPVIIFPDTKSKIFTLNRQILEESGFEYLIGRSFYVAYAEFKRFVETVKPTKRYDSGNIHLDYIFSSISQDLWDTPFEVLLDHIEKNYIIFKDTQESLIAYDWHRGSKHFLNLSAENDGLLCSNSSRNVEGIWEDPFDSVFNKSLLKN